MLSERMTELRKSRRLKLREISTAIGVSQSAVSMYESGERRPDYDTLMKIANYYGVTVDYLLRDENNLAGEDKLKFVTEAYARVMLRAKDSDITPHDLDMALDFLIRARQRDSEAE
jgi:transcriptional regulator with XRE-family HTH domain